MSGLSPKSHMRLLKRYRAATLCSNDRWGILALKLTITLVLETENEKNALTVVSQLNKLISAGAPTLENYHKGSLKALLEKDLLENRWPDAYLAGLSVAQTFGRSWTVLGCANDELSLVGNEFSIPGIKWAELSLMR